MLCLLLVQSHKILTYIQEVQASSFLFLCCFVRPTTFLLSSLRKRLLFEHTSEYVFAKQFPQ